MKAAQAQCMAPFFNNSKMRLSLSKNKPSTIHAYQGSIKTSSYAVVSRFSWPTGLRGFKVLLQGFSSLDRDMLSYLPKELYSGFLFPNVDVVVNFMILLINYTTLRNHNLIYLEHLLFKKKNLIYVCSERHRPNCRCTQNQIKIEW